MVKALGEDQEPPHTRQLRHVTAPRRRCGHYRMTSLESWCGVRIRKTRWQL